MSILSEDHPSIEVLVPDARKGREETWMIDLRIEKSLILRFSFKEILLKKAP
jgi:hypothetical protein